MLSDLPEATQLTGARAGIQTGSRGPRASVLCKALRPPSPCPGHPCVTAEGDALRLHAPAILCYSGGGQRTRALSCLTSAWNGRVGLLRFFAALHMWAMTTSAVFLQIVLGTKY